MHNMAQVAVAILNWNGLHHLQQFLPSVVKYSPEATVYLIDNGSTDLSIPWVEKHFPSVSIVALAENHGFCDGYNLGLADLKEEYFILLNSDVEVTPHWISPLLDLMETDAVIAACQPKLLDFNNKSRFEYAGAAGGYIDYLGTPFCKGRIFQTLEEDKAQYDTSSPVHWASGAALMIRARLYKAAGGFDSRFFAHMEEIDLCWRLRIQGYQIYSCPQSTVYHLGGGTLNTGSPKKTFLNVKNNLLMLNKNLPEQKRIGVLFLKLIVDGMAGVFFLLQGKWKDTLAIIKGHGAFYTSPSAKAEHTTTHQGGKLKAYETHFPYSIIWKYYLNKTKFFTDLPSKH